MKWAKPRVSPNRNPSEVQEKPITDERGSNLEIPLILEKSITTESLTTKNSFTNNLQEKETQTQFGPTMQYDKRFEEIEMKIKELSYVWGNVERVEQRLESSEQKLERFEAIDRGVEDMKNTMSTLKRSFSRVYGNRF